MAGRELDPRLKELYDNGIEVASISRIDCMNGCKYEAYKTYVCHERGRQNVYGALGTKIHDTLEKIVNNEAAEEDLLPAMQSELDDMDMLNIQFPKDMKGGDAIRDGWITDMTHFCNTYKSPKNANLTTEELFIYKTPKGTTLQGYIDLQKTNNDGSIDIYDYKTSSLYTGEELAKHGRQLVIYTLGKEAEGKKVNSASWIFLKYVEIEFMGKKTIKSKEKTLLNKVVERKKIASEMSKYIEQDLYELGYDEIDSEIILNKFKETNMFDVLPDNIKCNYKMKPYVLKYDVNDEIKQECIDYIDKTMDDWHNRGGIDFPEDYPPRAFTKVNKSGKEVDDYFYCSNLCGHFNSCPHIHDFLELKDANKDKDEFEDLF